MRVAWRVRHWGKKSSPSVAELLGKRAKILTNRVRGESVGSEEMEQQAETFVLKALDWDASPILPSAAALMCNYPENGHSLASMATLAMTMAEHGDRTALAEWGRWILTREPGDLFRRHQEKLTTLYSHPQHPAMQAVAKALFSAPAGKWWRSYRERTFTERDEALRLLVVPEARECWRQSLADTKKVGAVEVKAEGELSFRTASGTYGRGVDQEAGKLPTGTKQELRRCDEWADRLQAVRGFRPFCPAWTLEKRDAAIAEMRRILAEDGARLKLLGEKERDDPFSVGVCLEPR